MNKNPLSAQEIIKKISTLIADKIEEDNIKGACNRIPFILKYYLHRYYHIDIDIHFGLIEHNNIYAPHNWNSYEGQKIDITIHNQLIKDLNSDCVILNEIYIQKSGNVVYYSHDDLPKDYLDLIAQAIDEERWLKSISNRTVEDEHNLQKLTEMLDDDSRMIALEKRKMREIKSIKTFIKNYYKDDWNNILQYLKTKKI
ncbi:MAG: hypothetical protein PHW18_09760 [Sulfuricurvum sp.]|uniref:hypothetical protein n=1 Tax=Sulfuricurvum sp. TaxID=2025608 RepID=UPI00261471CF|nr:hypothetical protein [Sulfuricurvum sp.]MDD2829845.1 hypothetical protein [Sulfuricurvum sp.]MDD4949101.1 hypothetical protein [Sulfuricurvum sp.]